MLQEEPGTLRYSEGENVRTDGGRINLVGGKVGDQYTLLAIIIIIIVVEGSATG